jgi:hypothetical protein
MKRLLNLEGKSYSKCFACNRFYPASETRDEPRCRGLSTSDMPLNKWCEYVRDVATFFNLTNEYIAEAADVSLKTIIKIMSCKADQDIMRDTARRIENTILGADAQPPCYLFFEEFIKPDAKHMQEIELELINSQANLKMLNDTFRQEIDAVREEDQRKIQFLLAQVEGMRKDLDYLRTDNERKSNLIDKYMVRELYTLR